jgi:uncharacterized protein (TIGR00369 family)
MKKEIPPPNVDSHCFYCGRANAEGLQLHFFWDDEAAEVFTEYLPSRRFAGQGDVLHGGIQMGLLDEIMGWTSYYHTGEMAVTLNFNMSFIKPAYIGQKVTAVCRVLSRKGSNVHLQAELRNDKGVLCSVATGTFHILSVRRYKSLICEKKV